MEPPLIEFRDVTKCFGNRTVLDRVNLKIQEGNVTTIIGKSGVGKSVLLKHIIGLLKPDEGHIFFRGRSIDQMTRREKDAYLKQISYMFQNNALFDSLTVYENIAMPLRYTTRLTKSEIDRKVMARIKQTELEDVPGQYPSELSGGMQKRVALARALVTDPQIVLFDEPTTGQDPIRKNAILSMVAEYQKQLGFTAILISHDLPDVFFISNRILALYEGKIIFEGTPEAFDDFEHPFRMEFIRSLETLQEELSGLYSKRHFKVRYQSELHGNPQFDIYAVALFTLSNMDGIIDKLGHTAAQELIRSIGAAIDRHFSDVGGFSTRFSIDRYVTVLPHSNILEAQRLIDDFAREFQNRGLSALQQVVQADGLCTERIKIAILAGLAQGKPQVEIESIIEFAKFNQHKIAEFDADCGSSSN